MNKNFENQQQKLFWDAFSGKCGQEFKGNPCLMEGFINSDKSIKEEKEAEKE